MTRTNRVAQAISLWKALQTQAWAATHEEQDEPHYDFDAVDHLVRWFGEQERGWDDYLAGQDVLALTYDQIAGDLKDAVRRVLLHLDLDPTRADSVEPPMKRQADDRSREWAERYRAEA